MVEKDIDLRNTLERKDRKTIRATLTLNAEFASSSGQPLKSQVDIGLPPKVVKQAVRVALKRRKELKAIVNGDGDTLTKINTLAKVIIAESEDEECGLFSTEPACVVENAALLAVAFSLVFGDEEDVVGDILDGFLEVFGNF